MATETTTSTVNKNKTKKQTPKRQSLKGVTSQNKDTPDVKFTTPSKSAKSNKQSKKSSKDAKDTKGNTVKAFLAKDPTTDENKNILSLDNVEKEVEQCLSNLNNPTSHKPLPKTTENTVTDLSFEIPLTIPPKEPTNLFDKYYSKDLLLDKSIIETFHNHDNVVKHFKDEEELKLLQLLGHCTNNKTQFILKLRENNEFELFVLTLNDCGLPQATTLVFPTTSKPTVSPSHPQTPEEKTTQLLASMWLGVNFLVNVLGKKSNVANLTIVVDSTTDWTTLSGNMPNILLRILNLIQSIGKTTFVNENKFKLELI